MTSWTHIFLFVTDDSGLYVLNTGQEDGGRGEEEQEDKQHCGVCVCVSVCV